MRDQIDAFRRTLQAHSGALVPFIDWRPTERRNVEVFNDTASLYRYIDATEAAAFLYSCVQRAVNEDLPCEIEYPRRHDEAMRSIMNLVDMPDRLADALLALPSSSKTQLGLR